MSSLRAIKPVGLGNGKAWNSWTNRVGSKAVIRREIKKTLEAPAKPVVDKSVAATIQPSRSAFSRVLSVFRKTG